MATYTPNLDLKKPAGTDYVRVEDFNENSDKVDAKIGNPAQLQTVEKTNLVLAINEAAHSGIIPDGFVTDVKLSNAAGQVLDRLQQSLQGEAGRKLKLVACVIENDGSGNWRQVGGAHASINVASVTIDGSYIRITYSFTAKNAISFVACPDEQFVTKMYNFGASAGLNYADIIYSKGVDSVGGYISYNGSTWDISGSGITSASFNSGFLTINHQNISGLDVHTSVRDGKYVGSPATIGATSTMIAIRDYNGNLVTTPNTDMKIYFGRSYKDNAINPTNLNIAGANIWCMGVFEVE
jgi:hypothetical protein